MANQFDGSSVNQHPSEQDMIEKAKAVFESFKTSKGLSDFEMINGELYYRPLRPVEIIRLEDKQYSNGLNTEDLLKLL